MGSRMVASFQFTDRVRFSSKRFCNYKMFGQPSAHAGGLSWPIQPPTFQQIPKMPQHRFSPSVMHLISAMLNPSGPALEQLLLNDHELTAFLSNRGHCHGKSSQFCPQAISRSTPTPLPLNNMHRYAQNLNKECISSQTKRNLPSSAKGRGWSKNFLHHRPVPEKANCNQHSMVPT